MKKFLHMLKNLSDSNVPTFKSMCIINNSLRDEMFTVHLVTLTFFSCCLQT